MTSEFNVFGTVINHLGAVVSKMRVSDAIGLIKQGHSLKDKLVLFLYFAYWPIRRLKKITDGLPTALFDVTLKNADGLFYCEKNISAVFQVDTSSEKAMRKYFNIRSGVFVDIGAAIGKYTIAIGKRLKDSGKIVSIEPEKNNFRLLKHNVKLNRLKNVLLVNCACSDKEGYGNLLLDVSGIGCHSFYQDKVKSKERVRVRIRRLDNILKEVACKLNGLRINLIKIDVEGAEADVIRGGLKTISRMHPKIIVECWDEQRLANVNVLLSPLNYKIQKLNEENYLFF